MTHLAKILKRETALVARFLAVLGQEQTVLKSGSANSLNEINSEKLSLVEQLNQVEAERILLAKPSGGPGDRAGMAAWFTAHPQEKEAASLWEQLTTMAREAKVMHEINGQLIAAYLKQTSDALAILTQRQQEHTLYGSDGQASQITGSRIVDSA